MKREFVYRNPKGSHLDRYVSLEARGKLIIVRECRIAHKDDPKRGSNRQTDMDSPAGALRALRNQAAYFLKRGYVERTGAKPPRPAAKGKRTALQRWWDGLPSAWHHALIDLLPASARNKGPTDAALRKLVGRASLDLSRRQLADLSPLVKFKALTTLNLSHNPVNELEPLSKLRRLKTLWLASTDVDTIDRLPKLPALTALSLASTKLRSLEGLERFTALKELDVSNTRVAHLSPLEGMTKLRHLELNKTKVKSLEPLAESKALEELRCYMTPVKDLSPLEGSKRLRTLVISDTKIVDLTPLLPCPKLELVVTKGCKIPAANKRAFSKEHPGVLARRG